MPKIGEKTFDVRTIERALHRGSLKKSDYEKQLKSLPDDSENAAETRPGDAEFEFAGKSSET
jgi:hypothetical protein